MHLVALSKTFENKTLSLFAYQALSLADKVWIVCSCFCLHSLGKLEGVFWLWSYWNGTRWVVKVSYLPEEAISALLQRVLQPLVRGGAGQAGFSLQDT